MNGIAKRRWVILDPMVPENMLFSDETLKSIEKTAKLLGKRVGVGPVQTGIITLSELAEVLIEAESGFDSKYKKPWESKEYALRRIFSEYGYPAFNNAITLAVVRRHTIDSGFVPLAPGRIDVEATFTPGKELHRELQISGVLRPVMPIESVFESAISRKIGLTTEFGNRGDSIEFVAFLHTDGVWTHVKDIEKNTEGQLLKRKTGIIIVTSCLTLYVECNEKGKLTINNLGPVPIEHLSVKTLEAIKTMKAVYEECNMS